MTGTTLSLKIGAVSDIIRLRKQYGTLLLLCPTLWALFLASGGRPTVKHLVIFVLGSFLMRSAGCVVNDIADRKFDPLVERTKTRPLADGRLSVTEALFVFAVFSLLAFVLVLFLNPLTILLSLFGIVLAAAYPFVKRISHLPQAFLGMAFGWGAVMAWSAVTGTVGLPAVLIFFANVFFSMGYDTIYALMDIEDDRRIGVKSTAILFGERVFGALFMLYIIMAVFLAAAGLAGGLGAVFFVGLSVSLALLLVITARVKANPSHDYAFRGFVANGYVGILILLSIIVDSLFY